MRGNVGNALTVQMLRCRTRGSKNTRFTLLFATCLDRSRRLSHFLPSQNQYIFLAADKTILRVSQYNNLHRVMEATAGEAAEVSLLGKIKVPRLEDAGLEDCALPPEAIKEAFFKAAQSLRSWAVDTDEDGECVHDPKGAESSDSLIGIGPAPDPPGSCRNEKGLPEVIGDEVGSGFTEEKDDGFDKILGPEGVLEQGGDCVDGLRGLSIDKEKKKKKKNDLVKGGESDDDEEGDRNKEKPILTEGFAV